MIQKAEDGMNAGSAKKGKQSSKNKKVAAPVCVLPVKQHVKSSDAAKRCVTRTVKNRYGVCEGKVLNVQMIFVNESGFYVLVLDSKLDSAVKFRDWVTSVVLPQIRKTGGYIPVHEGESEEEMIRNAEEILRATLKEKEGLLETQRKLQEEQKEKLHHLNVKLGEQIVKLQQQGMTANRRAREDR